MVFLGRLILVLCSAALPAGACSCVPYRATKACQLAHSASVILAPGVSVRQKTPSKKLLRLVLRPYAGGMTFQNSRAALAVGFNGRQLENC
jgi:hypothetical protein